jgi:hypothetical protein
MKVILTGVTGFIGSEVLTQCCKTPAITSIIALSRWPLSTDITKDPRVEIIVMKNFTTYSKEVIEQFEGADACIWYVSAFLALNGKHLIVIRSMGTKEGWRDIDIDYPLAFCHAMAPIVAKQKKAFRYIHLSGRLAEQDQSRCLLFLSEGRRIKGKAELEILDFENNEEKLHGGYWQSYIAKPSMVLKKQKKGEKCELRWLSVLIGSVDVDELAAAMIDIGRYGSEEPVLNNAEVVMRGRAALDADLECYDPGYVKSSLSLW